MPHRPRLAPAAGPAAASVTLALPAAAPARAYVRAASGSVTVERYTATETRRWDRVVFVFAGGLPYERRARYRPPWSLLNSRTDLYVRFFSAWALTFPAGKPTAAGQSRTANLSVLRRVVIAEDFEGYVTYRLALRRRAGFHVWTARRPDRVIIDLLR